MRANLLVAVVWLCLFVASVTAAIKESDKDSRDIYEKVIIWTIAIGFSFGMLICAPFQVADRPPDDTTT